MTANYAAHLSTRKTPQSSPIPGKQMVENSAGGFVFPVDDFTRLDRWLLMGCEGNTYYQTERQLTVENAQAVKRCLAADPVRTIGRIVEISQAGRAPKNDPAIFALALAFQDTPAETKALAEKALPEVARIGTHLFSFNEAIKQLGCRNKAANRAIRHWFLDKEVSDVAYQVTKYQQRNGWSHRDLLRLARPKTEGVRQDLFHWIVKGWPGVGDEPHPEAALRLVWALEKAKRATSAQEIVRLITDYGLVRECIPTQFLTEITVWDALLQKMPLTALVRNLATMTRIGLIAPLSAAAKKVVDTLADGEYIKKSRLHPIAILSALRTYAQGHGERSSNNWTPVSQIVNALDAAFYLAFANVEPTNKRWLLALDVSGSMGCGHIAGVPGLTPREASAALALVTAATEPQHQIVAFTSNGSCARASMHVGYPSSISPVNISPRMRLNDAIQVVSSLPMGGTDCALPMIYAAECKVPVDVFVTITDSETWAGNIAPTQALQEYRRKLGIPAKLVVIAMTSTEFSIADPDDAGQMDCVGFSADVPQLLANFAVE